LEYLNPIALGINKLKIIIIGVIITTESITASIFKLMMMKLYPCTGKSEFKKENVMLNPTIAESTVVNVKSNWIEPKKDSSSSKIFTKKRTVLLFCSFNSSILFSPNDEIAILAASKNPANKTRRANITISITTVFI
jgi:hypothetical protein